MEHTRSIDLPVSDEGTERLLSGSRVEGIGPAFAKKLVARFGGNSVSMLRDHPAEVAEEIPGLGTARAEKASGSLKKIEDSIPLLLFLYSCGIGDIFIDRIIGKYRKKAQHRVLTDPYSMVEDVWQLSFYVADKIGKCLGIQADDPLRLQAALVMAVKYAAEAGHLFATPDQAVETAAGIAGVEPELISRQIGNTVASGRLVKSRGGLYLPVFYNAEKEGAATLSQLASVRRETISESDLPERSRLGHIYSSRQREAIRTALEYHVMVITGGPGSGKTTVVKGIIDMFEHRGDKVVLCAPTGRAAKRLEALSGHHASTIHSLLGYRQGEGYYHKKLDADVLIIDEGSMMEQVLFNHLLQALRPGARIILVGDADQLQAIGAGNVLRDLIASGTVPVVHLDDNFRQAEGSLIASGARDINDGRLPQSDPERDLMIVVESSVARIHDKIMSLVADELPVQRGISPQDMLVVTPQQIGKLGARQLNLDLQQRLNPVGPALTRGTTTMRLGDPVMQRVNSRERGVYNGEVGRITEVDTVEQRLEVTFSDGRKSSYVRTELGEITLSYATTVHKLQGSEARNVIIPVTMSHRPMLYRNLLYTAVSRATDLCVLVGEEVALSYAIGNTASGNRNSNFRQRLRKINLTQQI
ncbi:MAG: AAA family ATPase [Muribaculaceae bacterium]|nr:AAA family ATPase [Muribaculaceae bacterium]